MTRQEIRQTLIQCAAHLKHVPSLQEFTKMSPVSHRQIVKHFGGYIPALRATGLELKSSAGRGHAVPMEELLADWCRVVQKLKKIPSTTGYMMHGKYSVDPFLRRFGSWLNVPAGLKKFAQKDGLAKKWKRELALVPAAPLPKKHQGTAEIPHQWPDAIFDRPFYGSPMWAWPMAYAPVNEFGVIFLFGAMSWRLGFVVHRIHADFPDCEAMRRVIGDRWQLVKIEFEMESRNFRRHHHNAKKCDLIVCWKHNWPECPLEVLELSKLINTDYLPELFDRRSQTLGSRDPLARRAKQPSPGAYSSLREAQAGGYALGEGRKTCGAP